MGDSKDGYQGFERKALWLVNNTRRRGNIKKGWDPVWQAFYPEKNPTGTARVARQGKGRMRASSDSSDLTELSSLVPSRVSSSRPSEGPSKRRRIGSGGSRVEDEVEDEEEEGMMEE